MARQRGSVKRGRRDFLRAVPAAAVGAGLAAPAASDEPRLDREALGGAAEVAGVAFSPEEQEQILGNARRFRANYEAVRRLAIAHDVEPAFRFAVPRSRPSAATAPASAPAPAPARPAGDTTRARALPPADELLFLPVTELAALVAARRVSATELARLSLARLKQHGPALECVVTLMEEQALAQAERADAELRGGHSRGPLHGLPWGVKDLFATRGVRTTWGAKPYEAQVIDTDATAVARLAAAGAVLVAKLTTGELAIGDRWFGGRTRNPWQPAEGASGSSAGPAAATAAGLVAFAVGTETGGSIVSPASTCGVVGLRPTYGRISRHGVMALRWTMDKVGTLCRAVEDSALVMDALRGPDGHDDTVVDAPFDWRADPDLGGLRIGFVERELQAPPATASADEKARFPERQRLQQQALETLRAAGAEVVAIALPELPAEALYRILVAESGAMFDELVRSGRVSQLAVQDASGRAHQLRTSRFIPAVEYIQAQRARTLLIREVESRMRDVHAFVALPDGESVAVTNLTGHPAVTLPCGFVGGLPEGLMVTGRIDDEATLLRVALAFERRTPWHRHVPPGFGGRAV